MTDKPILLKIKSAFKIVLVNLLILFALMVIADPFLKIEVTNIATPTSFDTRNIRLREIPPNSDYQIVPTQKDLKASENLMPDTFRVRTDENGFLIGDISPNTNANLDVLFFGGSTTECLYVAENKRFPYLVGQYLNDSISHKNIKTLNGGVSGNSSINSTLNLLAKGVSAHPKIVVFMHNINDLTLLSRTGSYYTAPEHRSIIESKIEHTPTVNDKIVDFKTSIKQLFIPNINERYYRLKLKLKPKPEMDEWANLRRPTSYNINQIETLFTQSVNTFIEVAKAHQIEVILMTQFNRLNKNDAVIQKFYEQSNGENGIPYAEFCEYYDRFNAIIREIAEQKQVHLIDLDQIVPQNKTYMMDAVHLNEQGSILVAKEISYCLSTFYPEYTHILNN